MKTMVRTATCVKVGTVTVPLSPSVGTTGTKATSATKAAIDTAVMVITYNTTFFDGFPSSIGLALAEALSWNSHLASHVTGSLHHAASISKSSELEVVGQF